jgi:hypothetical protein
VWQAVMARAIAIQGHARGMPATLTLFLCVFCGALLVPLCCGISTACMVITVPHENVVNMDCAWYWGEGSALLSVQTAFFTSPECPGRHTVDNYRCGSSSSCSFRTPRDQEECGTGPKTYFIGVLCSGSCAAGEYLVPAPGACGGHTLDGEFYDKCFP